MITKPKFIIDIHTHLFNAKYVPLEEIFVSRKVPRRVAGLLARFALALTGQSRLRLLEAAESADESLTPACAVAMTEKADEADLTDALIDKLIDLAITELYLKEQGAAADRYDALEAIEDSELYRVLTDIEREYGDSGEDDLLALLGPNGFVTIGGDPAEFAGVHDKGLFLGLRSMLRRFLRKAAAYVEDAEDLLDFVFTMTFREKALLERLERYYEEQGIDFLLVHYMMDMEYPFGGAPRFPYYTDQLRRMSALEQHSKGRVIGFSAFDPLRFVSQGASIEEIEAQLEQSLSYGKLGFKFYPPMGYRPAENVLPRLEKVVDIFLDYCAAHEIPVFTHCTPEGFEQSPGNTGSNAHPMFWEAALKKPGRDKLILCFGHAGGGERHVNGRMVHGWLSSSEEQWCEDKNNYARWVVRLCRQYPNVYCEIAYMHEIIHSDRKKEAFKQRLAAEYARKVDDQHPYPLSDKIMYGSDWHMPSMVNDIYEYLSDVFDIYEDSTLAPHREKFFSGNALNYLRIDKFIERVTNQLGTAYAEALASRCRQVRLVAAS